MLKLENVDPVLIDLVENKMDFVESLLYYDRDLIWLTKFEDKFYLVAWQDLDQNVEPSVDQHAYFEYDVNPKDRLKTEKYLDVLKSANRVIVTNHYFIPFKHERPEQKDEACSFDTAKWVELTGADNGLPNADVVLFELK